MKYYNDVLEKDFHYNKTWAIKKTNISQGLQIHVYRDGFVTRRKEIHLRVFIKIKWI